MPPCPTPSEQRRLGTELQLSGCCIDGSSAKNWEGIMLGRGYLELYSLVQFILIKYICGAH
jgi:hypothetical protein